MRRFRSLLASIRIANAPSVVSNVTLGYFLGSCYWGLQVDLMVPTLILLAVTALLLLFAGNLANDWFDREWDHVHRPERALPAGLFRPVTYLTLAILCMIGAVGIASTLGLPALLTVVAILACIAIYTWAHKQHRWAVLPMGCCRALLYILGVCAAFHALKVASSDDPFTYLGNSATYTIVGGIALTHAAGLLVYVMGLSLAARFESLENPPTGPLFLARAMLFLPLAAMSAWWVPYYPLLGVCGMIPFVIWLGLSLTIFRKPIPRFVSALLAGIPLIDLIAAVPIGATFSYPGDGVSTASMIAFTTPAVAFLLGRLLQRVAPAT